MKIAILSRPRTFSTAIGKTLAYQNQAKYLGETYVNVLIAIRRYYHYRKSYDLDKAMNHFKNKLAEHTNTVFSNTNFVTKIFPSMLYFPPGIITERETFEEIKRKYIFDLEIFNLSNYDKIYILERDLKKSLISWIYSSKIQHFHLNKNEKYAYPNITIGLSDFNTARFHIVEYCLLEKFKKYLDEKNLSYSIVSENNFYDHVHDDILETEKTPINYNEYITNITDLEDFINYWYPICKEQTQNWTFY